MAGSLRLALVLLLVLAPALAGAQTLSGVTEWAVSRGADTSDGQVSANNSFWQNYAVSYDSFFLDPRLLKYDAGLIFRTSQLTFGSDQDAHQGGQHGLGYQAGMSLFPARPFPLNIQLSRNAVNDSGNFPSTASVVRGGIVVPPGQPLPDFQTNNNSFAINWRLRAENLPQVDFGYRANDNHVSGGGYEAEQQDNDLHAGVAKETANTRQSLRFQKTSFQNLLAQSFNQHFNELDYEFSGMLGHRARVTAHAGRRSSFSLFDAPPQVVDAGVGVAAQPLQGKSDTTYAISGLTFDPNRRISLAFTGSVDEQKAATTTTTSQLATTTARLEPFTGLSLSGTGVYGSRGQLVAGVPVSVLTRTGQVGSSYRKGVRWLMGSVSLTRGLGQNSAEDGRLGDVRSWSADASLSVSVGPMSASAGYERLHGDDEILDFGNYEVWRRRGSLQYTARRLSLTGIWDQTVFDRGRGTSFAHVWQETFSSSLALRLWQDSQVTGTGGGFDSRTLLSRDRTYFVGANYESHFGRVLLSGSLRDEYTLASATNLDQWSLFGYAKAEYTKRQFGFALEYRRSAQDLQFGQLVDPTRFRGRQFNMRISRKFGIRL